MPTTELNALKHALQCYKNNLDQFEQLRSDADVTKIGLKLLRSRDAIETQIQLKETDWEWLTNASIPYLIRIKKIRK